MVTVTLKVEDKVAEAIKKGDKVILIASKDELENVDGGFMVAQDMTAQDLTDLGVTEMDQSVSAGGAVQPMPYPRMDEANTYKWTD